MFVVIFYVGPRVAFFRSLRYFVNTELEIAILWFVAIFNIEQWSCDFCSLRYFVNIELKIAT